MNQPTTNKLPQSLADLQKQLYDQLKLLKALCELYDNGDTIVAKSIATSVRVLVHNTNKSSSLLSQLGHKNIKFHDTAGGIDLDYDIDTQRIGPYHALVGAGTANSKYIPYLDNAMPGALKYVTFDEYWNRKIFIDSKGNIFTRKDIILAVANKDGGAHVDPKLDERYVELSRKNSMGIISGINNNLRPIEGAELAAIRQIGHELIRTLDTKYPKKNMKLEGSFGVLASPVIVSKKPPVSFMRKKEKIGRNDPCPCESGRKYKYCCGR